MALVLFQLGLEAFEQGESVCGGTGKAGQHPTVVQLAHLAGRALDDDVAQGHLAITTDGHQHAGGGLPTHAEDGRSVKLFHSVLR